MASESGLGYTLRPPNSFTPGRKAGQPTVIFIHTTEGSEGPSSAEDGAAYDARRTDGTSTHFFVDSNSVVQCVRTTDEAHAARTHGNDVGIQIEICGRTGQTPGEWADLISMATVEQAAHLCVKLRAKYFGRFPLVNLTPAQLRAGRNGFAEHLDATLAWPEDGGTHTDPGPNFPWSRLFARISQLESGDDMAAVDLTTDSVNAVATAVVSKVLGASGPNLGQDIETLETFPAKFAEILAAVQAVSAPVIDVPALAAAIAAELPDTAGVTEARLVQILNTATFSA